MRALYVSSEVQSLAKTGGLADVSRALPAALRAFGIDVRLLMPGYPGALALAERRGPTLRLPPLPGIGDVSLVPAYLPGSDIPVWLVDCPALYDRPGGLYTDAEGCDWPDNPERFGLLSLMGAMIAAGRAPVGWQPDIVHANDWHAGLLPLFTRAAGTCGAPPVLFTIHNMAFQGVCDTGAVARLGLASGHRDVDDIEFYGKISFLKAGIRFADRLTTVSPTYAREIVVPEFGCGLEGLLARRNGGLSGILNGVDYGLWDPAHDPLIPARFDASDPAGKRASKRVVQEAFRLEIAPDVPLIGYMSRLTGQKMADRVLAIAPAIAERHGQLLVVAEGERHFEEAFRDLALRHPGRIAVAIGYEEHAAHCLLAGADMLLAPARFEPCGLTQLYAMRYGTLPIVHATGGLADTVVDATPASLAGRTATGFHIGDTSDAAMLTAIERAVSLYGQPLAWRRLRDTAMRRDFSWAKSASRYIELYRDMTAGDTGMIPRSESLRA